MFFVVFVCFLFVLPYVFFIIFTLNFKHSDISEGAGYLYYMYIV